MKLKLKTAVGSLLVGGVLAGAAVMPASGQAADPGDLCWIHGSTGLVIIFSDTNTSFGYSLPRGSAFRILGYAGDFYRGRGNGMPEGYIYRYEINQATCV